MMSISLVIGDKQVPIGSSAFLNAFFSTIAARLEGDRWGERFPIIMRRLYSGQLDAENIDSAICELNMIRTELGAHTPTGIVWDFHDRSTLPPWGTKIASTITSLANYFVTSNGEDLFDVLLTALEEARSTNREIQIT